MMQTKREAEHIAVYSPSKGSEASGSKALLQARLYFRTAPKSPSSQPLLCNQRLAMIDVVNLLRAVGRIIETEAKTVHYVHI